MGEGGRLWGYREGRAREGIVLKGNLGFGTIFEVFPLCILFVCLLLASGLQAAPLRELDAALKQSLQQLLQDRCAGSSFRGVSYSIAVPGYEVWTGTYGDLGYEEFSLVEESSVFGIASITKTYVAAIMFQLRDEGLVDFEATVESYLGQISNIPEDVRVRHLLSMTSGLYNFSDSPLGPTSRAVANKDLVLQPREMLDRYLGTPRFEAGSRYMYSNTNYVVLGMIIEEVTGQPFVEVLRERLLEPLALEETYLGGFDVLPEAFALTDFTSDGRIDEEADAAQAAVSRLFWTSGGMFATSRDLARWGQALYGGKVLKEVSLAEMVDFDADGFGQYGMGAMPDEQLGYAFWGHGGLLSYVSSMIYSPDTGITVAFVANSNRRFGSITYWPHGDMLGRLREQGVDQELEVDAVDIQFTDTEDLRLNFALVEGLPESQVGIEIVGGPAEMEEGRLRIGGSPGLVELRVGMDASGFFRSGEREVSFEVYERFGDADGDGRANALESLVGTDLRVKDRWAGPLFSVGEGRARLAFEPQRDDIPYRFEKSVDLENWEKMEGDELGALGDSVWAEVELGDEGVFLRLGVE